MLCALCLRDPSTGPTLPGRDRVGYPGAPYDPEAITIANGQALCRTHFERLADRQTDSAGPVSLLRLVEIMHAPAPPPTAPWRP